MNIPDLEKLRTYVSEYMAKRKYRFSSDAAAIEVSQIESAIRGIVARNPNDREIVLEGVSVDGFLLEYASDELKSDPLIVSIAIKNNPNATQFVKNADVLIQVMKEIALDPQNEMSDVKSK